MNINIASLTTIILNLALATLIGSGASAVAQPPWARGGQGGPGIGGGGNFDERFAKILGLTDAQKTQIKNLREQAQTAAKPYYEQIKPITDQMRNLIEAPVFDESSARALAGKMSQVQTEIHLIQAKTEAAIYQLLTAEQKTKWAELRKARQERGGPPSGLGEGRRSGFGRSGN